MRTTKTEEVCEALANLPPEAQQEVADFIAFLRTRYARTGAVRKSGAGDLSDEPFIGMWRDREDLEDSHAWVRELRGRRQRKGSRADAQ